MSKIGDIAPKAKILYLDIETLPNLGWTWGKYEQDVIRFQQESCIATYAAKWAGGRVFANALPNYPNYKPRSYDDKRLVAELRDLLHKADIVVAHNGIDFDVKVINSRLLVHQIPPPLPYKIIDTKREMKKVARFNSNKLDDLGQLLLNQRKIKTDFDLWLGCINGDKKSWEKMIAYNKKDVELLERVYLRLRPWISNHPNMTLLVPDAQCPKCGSEKLRYEGFSITGTRTYQRFQCKKCGGWGGLQKAMTSTGFLSS